jgi:hypothetical protein
MLSLISAVLQVRFLARGFTVSGDHTGQTSTGVRWPYGPVCIITPFNFPLEIPVLQLMGALYMGNKPLLHVDHRVSIVAEQFLRLLIDCGMPATDVDLLHGPGTTVSHIIEKAQPRSTLFTGVPQFAQGWLCDLEFQDSLTFVCGLQSLVRSLVISECVMWDLSDGKHVWPNHLCAGSNGVAELIACWSLQGKVYLGDAGFDFWPVVLMHS